MAVIEDHPAGHPVHGASEEEATGATTDFDYLLGMPIYSLTHEKIEKLLEQSAAKEAELLALLELTPIQIWNTDLDNFLAQWEVCGYAITILVLW